MWVGTEMYFKIRKRRAIFRKKILGLKNVHDRSHFVRNSMVYLLYKLTPLHSARNFFKRFHGPSKAKPGTPNYGLKLGSFES